MNKTGVIEGFFGPQWPEEDRLSYASFLAQCGGNFYIYAPKQDPYLRKKWRETWQTDYVDKLKNYARTFHAHGVEFGVGFSPFGLGAVLTEEDQSLLAEKLNTLNEIGIDLLGLFFDDMPTNANLARTQIEALRVIQSHFNGRIVFCPSYYTPDPILDKVFGQRPDHYLEDIAAGIPSNVSIAWTGPKVISPVIDEAHLLEVGSLLKRKPFIWENLFANDGPKNCKFLKLKPFTGRDERTFRAAEAFGLNLMNQPELSKILYYASKLVLDGIPSEEAYLKALDELCTPVVKEFICGHQDSLLVTGLDNLSDELKRAFKDELGEDPSKAAKEILDWLNGEYNVGTECLTD